MSLRLQLQRVSQSIKVGDLRSLLGRKLLSCFHFLQKDKACDPEVRLFHQFGHELEGSPLVVKTETKNV